MTDFSISVCNEDCGGVKQIVAGFMLLQEAGVCNFSYSLKPALGDEFYSGAIVEIVANGRRLIVETTDGYNNYPSFSAYKETLRNVDCYIRSNYRDEYERLLCTKGKVFAGPPRYCVTVPGSPVDKLSISDVMGGGVFRALKLGLDLSSSCLILHQSTLCRSSRPSQ